MAEQSIPGVRKAQSAPAADFQQDWRKLNTGRILYEGFELYNTALLKSLEPSGFVGIRNTHFNLLRHLDAEGTRMTDLATRSNLTKPAITSLVRACQALDLVTVEQSAGDARARVVRFSPRGIDLMRHIQGALLTIECNLVAGLGLEAYGQLRAALLSLSGLRDVL